MDSATKDESGTTVGEPSIAPLTRGKPIQEEHMTDEDQDASILEDENSDDEEEEDEEESDEEDEEDSDGLPSWDGGNPRAPIQKGVAGNLNGPPQKKKKEGEGKSGSESGEKKDDKKDEKTDEEKDGESRSDSETLKAVA